MAKHVNRCCKLSVLWLVGLALSFSDFVQHPGRLFRWFEIEVHPPKRKVLLWISILVNLGLLGFFKYYNFFLDNFITAFLFFGTTLNANTLNIILPVGISFYTFQT
jgi:D-alanyl-lipoteichoic acid acyltransferase DltB (MBOAT superfamily)